MNQSRRDFIKKSAIGAAGMVVGGMGMSAKSYSRIPGANERLNLAVIGSSNMGGYTGSIALKSELTNGVAFCDVVPSRADGIMENYKDAPVFDDFRKMFDKMGNQIDACTIGTPDHSHFPIAMLAISLGKHVYVEKPLAHTFEECELLIAAEKKYGVACQMGNQGHSAEQRLQFREWVNAGIIKNVTRVDACMNKGRRWYPWGHVTGFPPAQDMPDGMNWDVWAGTAPKRAYNEKLDPGNWRGWYDYGNGAFGDWGPHTLDSVHRFLELGLPYEIRADKLIGPNAYIYPKGSTIAFEFAERGPNMPAMAINWYDGRNNRPPRPRELAKDQNVPRTGKVIYSDNVNFMGGTHARPLSIIPNWKAKEMSSKLPEIPEGDTSRNHMDNFLRTALGKDPRCNSSFEVAGPLTQVFMLGSIAQRLGGTLKFDTQKKQVTNNDRANQLLKGHPPREGWEEFYKV